MTRAIRARRLFRTACVLWLLLVPLGQVFHLPYLRPAWRVATWDLSLGVLTLVWIGTSLWSGVVQLGYRGIGSRTVSRSDEPTEFWWHLAIAVLFGITLVAVGAARLLLR